MQLLNRMPSMPLPLSFLLLLLINTQALAADSSYVPGQPCCARPAALTSGNFEAAVQDDPANSFWFLKFYAPWCGHCKRMAPILDKVAPQVAGQMAIGKIDCTIERSLCSTHGVKGYPTLKFALDGVIHDYPGGRGEQELLQFAQKMTRPMVRPVTTLDQALHEAQQNAESGVVFLAHHPSIPTEEATADIQQALQTQPETQVLAQVARQFRITADFLLLTTTENDDQSSIFPELVTQPVLDLIQQKKPFVCRLEPPYVETKCVTNGDSNDDNMILTSTASLSTHVEAELVPTVSMLGPHNFHSITRKGRAVMIGVVRDAGNAQLVDEMRQLLTQVAASTTKHKHVFASEHNNPSYYYGIMDGAKYSRFLEQFEIKPAELPQLFVLDAPEGEYWRNTSTFYHPPTLPGALQFLQHLDEGILETQLTKDAKTQKLWYNRIINTAMFYLVEYRPWSIVVVVLLVMGLAIGVAMCLSPAEDDDLMMEQMMMMEETTATPEGQEGTPNNDGATKETKEESKKDK